MIGLKQYISENFNDLKLSKSDKNKLVELDKEFNSLVNEFEKEHIHYANVTNIREQINYIISCVRRNNPVELKLKYEDSKLSDNDWCDQMIKKLNNLKLNIYDIDCIFTKYYVYRINKIIEQIIFLNNFSKHKKINCKVVNRPSTRIYKQALKILKENPYVDINELAEKDPDYKRDITPEKAKKILQKEIDGFGYGWKVIIDDNMVPRMSVRPYKEFRINAKNNFSKVDIESLKVHEIAVHVARKYYSLEHGLFLFLQGLKDYNVYDEGLAIYNSLNKVKKPKPNILFYTCMKIIILYHLYDKNITEVFHIVKKLTGVSDKKIALAIIRVSRIFIYTSLGNYSYDADYLEGYLKVKDMSDEERENILKYPIGPDQLFEIKSIKKFLKINNFEPIKLNEIEQ